MCDTAESVDTVKARHKKEIKAQDGTGRKLLKQANKNKAKTAEAENKISQMKQETTERHRCELEAAQLASSKVTPQDAGERGEIADDSTGGGRNGGVEKAAEGLREMSLEDKENQKRDQKRSKAQRKREKQREKELEREQRIEKEKAEGSPDPRIVEMEALGVQVAPRGFRVREIKADGHCLYRAVAEQLSVTGRRSSFTEDSYMLMREEAARELRSSPGDYLPFLDGVQEGDDFERYCKEVEGSAEWGGQVELQALCSALEVPMEVFSAVSPLLVLGENFTGDPLRLTYHEHYYALGAHYNSVVPS